jgi:hypothetical protein
MSNYVKATNFTAKDSLPTGNAGKIVKGAEIDTELTAVASAISSKADLNSPSLTGTPTAPTQSSADESTKLATTAYVASKIAAISAGVTSVAAGTGISISGTGAGPYTGAVTVTNTGALLSTTQTFTGAKTFSGGATFTGGITSTDYNFNANSSIYLSSSVVSVDISGSNIAKFDESSGASRMRLDNSGWGIQSDSAGIQLGITSGTYLDIQSSRFRINYDSPDKPTAGQWGGYSDQRLKTDITNYTKGLADIKSLRAVTYKFNDVTELGKQTNYKQYAGLIAQEVEQTNLSSMITEKGDGYKQIDPSELTYTMINAIKELSAEIEALKAKLPA